jgi:serine protease Do
MSSIFSKLKFKQLMKKINVKLIGLICCLLLFCSVNVFAQQETETKTTKKVVIVKKTTDKNGKVKVERVEKEGKEAEDYIKELDVKELDVKSIDGETVEIEIETEEGSTVKEGKKKRVEIIEIDDIDELSDELKKELKDLNIEIDILDGEMDHTIDIKEMTDSDEISLEGNKNIELLNVNKDEDETTIDVTTKDGQKKKFKYKGEMPENVRKELEAMGVTVGATGGAKQHVIKKRIVVGDDENPNPDKGFLGVVMSDKKSSLGVVIDEVVEGSGAEKAGLKSADIITTIDGKKVANSDELIEALKDKKKNEEVKISYIRGEATNKVVATLGETKPAMRKVWVTTGDQGNMLEHHMRMNGGSSFFIDKDNDKVATINVEKENDVTKLTIKGKDNTEKIFEWTGEMPDNVRKELDAMDVKIIEGGQLPHKMGEGHGKQMIRMKGGNPNKAFLGVEPSDKKSDKGFSIGNVIKDSAAEKAGLKGGDVITAINDKKIATFDDLVKALSDKKVGDKIAIEYLRDDKANKAEATLGENKSGGSWMTTSDGGEEIEIHLDNDFDFDFEGGNIEIEGEDGENIFLFRPAKEGESKPFLGVLIDIENEGSQGVKLSGTAEGSGAEKAGLLKNDVVTSIDAKTVNSLEDIRTALEGKKTGDKIKVNYTRDGKEQSTEVELGEYAHSKTMNFEFKEDDEAKVDGEKKVVKRKVIVIKKDGDDKEKKMEEKIIIHNGSAGNFDDQKVKVFPNPTTNQITVQFNGEDKPFTLTVQDVAGKEIHREEVKNFGTKFEKQIDISNAAAGMLIVTINQGDEVYKLKVLKQ